MLCCRRFFFFFLCVCVCVCSPSLPATGLLMVHSPELPSNCCFVALKKGVTPKIRTCVVLSFKLAFFLTVMCLELVLVH